MKKPKTTGPVEVDPEIAKKIQETAMFMADMTMKAGPSVQTSSAAVLLSSLIINHVVVGKRLKVFDKFVADMRNHIVQANSKANTK